MPQTVRSDKWFFRVTMPHVALTALLAVKWNERKEDNMFKQGFKSWGIKRMLIVYHTGIKTEKEHMHAIVELDKEIQQQAMNARIKTMFGVKGADYSSKVWDGNMGVGAGSYLFHDPNAQPTCNEGFTEDEIRHFMKCNEDVKAIVEEKKEKASGRCVERILKCIEDDGKCWTRKQILLRMVNDIHDGVMYEPGDFVLKKYCEEIYMKQIKDKKQWAEYANHRVSTLMYHRNVEEAPVELFYDK